MIEVNPKNERIKRRYLYHMQNARGLAASTIDNALRALAEYERFTGFRDFAKFSDRDAVAYKKKLLSGGGRRAAELSNRSTVHGKLQPLQRFLNWLAEQPGYRTKLRFSDIEFLNLSNRDAQIARDRPAKPAPSLEQMQHAIRSLPASTPCALRDRAMMCCILLTGSRVQAVTTLKLKHVRDDRLGITFDAREVRTKFSKSFTSFWYPVGDDIREMFLAYVDYLRDELRWNAEDPLFPKTRQAVGDACHFHTVGLARAHWATTDPVRQVFKRAFAVANLPYYSPHTIRHLLARMGQRICRTAEELRAWSQNMAHDDTMTTLKHYGGLPEVRHAEVMTSLGGRLGHDEQEAFEAFKSMRGDPRFGAAFALR